ncbi:hypothetical protein LTR14_000558 [Exophiala xenobiotica]|nr:hypothetical protein LTR14_000558 [Exophiala xenobiotica]
MATTGVGPRRWEIIGRKGGPWEKVDINSSTDGQPSQWPVNNPTWKARYRRSSEERHLIHLAKAWMKQRGQEHIGVEYYLDKLPDGYALFETNQLTGSQVFKRLFGHPSGKYYDSIVKFEVHFLWLMSGKQGQCDCVNCGKPQVKPVVRRKSRPAEFENLLPDRRRDPIQSDSNVSSRSTSAAGGALGFTSRRPQRQMKPAGAPYAVDADGQEDVIKDLLRKLEIRKNDKAGIEDNIREENSIDWRAEHEFESYGKGLIQQNLTLISQQHSFAPRIGELVLWTPQFLDGHYLMIDTETGEYKYYSFEQKCFHGFPKWRGGLITQVPIATAMDGPVDFPDIQNLVDKQNSLNTSGFRVETFPDPNEEIDKTASKQYRYVPLRNIRPLSHWQILLRGIPRAEWHPSIEYALTCMTSLSLYEKFWFKGEWPNGMIFFKGLYIGSEFIMAGDAVRLTPAKTPAGKVRRCTDVMVVESIRLRLLDIRPEDVLPDTPLLAPASSIIFVGRAFTLDIRRHYQMQGRDPDAAQTVLPSPLPDEEVKTTFRPVGTGGYGSWYNLHDPEKKYVVSYDRVLGRLYEAGAVRLWTGQLQFKPKVGEKVELRPELDFDMGGIEGGRRYASQTDERMEEPEEGQLGWFWADTRAEALDIQTINGIEVGKYHGVRDPRTLEQWREYMKLINGHTATPDLFKYTSSFPSDFPSGPGTGKRGRKPGSKLINGKVVMPGDPGYEEAGNKTLAEPHSTPRHKTSQLAGAALVSTDEEDEDEEDVVEDSAQVFPSVERPSMHEAMRRGSPIRQQKKVHARVHSKAQIMGNPDDIEDDINNDEEDDAWYLDIPPVRGGTEESEGGDYRPVGDYD